MITDLLIFIPSIIIKGFAKIFSIFNLPGIEKIVESITYIANFLNYIGIFFPPLYDILNAVGIVISCYVLWYTLKIALYLWGHAPWIGKHAPLPKG